MQGHLPVVEYLCDKSADVNQADNNGWTPLLIAVVKVSINMNVIISVRVRGKLVIEYYMSELVRQ